MKTLLTLCAAALLGAPAFAAEHVFPHPDRVRYDGQCFTLDGRDTFLFGGAFHYFRCPRELWRERFRRIQAAGCNAVETYVPWNYSERLPAASPDAPASADLTDLRDWLRMAHDEFHFYTIVRPGPYICAEWDGGGFPAWLLARRPADWKGMWLRSDEPSFLAWSQHWLRAVWPVIAPEQVTKRAPGTGGVVLVQIENEYDGLKAIPEEQRPPHLRALLRCAREGGIDVPVFTCWTKECRDSQDPELRQVFDAFNSYTWLKIGDTVKDLADVQAAQPDAPAMISELQGGWFAHVGGTLSEDQGGLNAAQLQGHTLIAIAHGAVALNYYMLFGGTNFGYWAGRYQTTSYDYGAPIREWGGGGDKYRAVAGLGAMLRAYGPELARSRAAAWPIQTGSPDVTAAVRVARSGASWVFFQNWSEKQPRHGRAAVWSEKAGEIGIDYALEPFGSRVLRLPPGSSAASEGEWLPHVPAPEAAPASGLPPSEPLTVTPSRAGGEMRATPLLAVAPGQLLPELGQYESRPIVYRADPVLSADDASRTVLRARVYCDDRVVAEVNGRRIATPACRVAHEPDGGDPLPHQVGVQDLPIAGLLRPGVNHISILYIPDGRMNYGPGIDDEPGLHSLALAGGTAPELPIAGLSLAPGEPVAFEAAFRTGFPGPSPSVAWRVKVDATGDGELILNGHSLGRYWGEGPQRRYYLPAPWLRPGRNELEIRLLPPPDGRPAVVRSAALEPVT